MEQEKETNPLPLRQAGGTESLLTHDDQLFIFETAGLLIASGNFDGERRRLLMQNLVSPVLEKFVVLLDELARLQAAPPAARAASEERRQLLAQCLSHAMSAVAWSSKAFSNAQAIKVSGCLPVYLNALQVRKRQTKKTIEIARKKPRSNQFNRCTGLCGAIDVLNIVEPRQN